MPTEHHRDSLNSMSSDRIGVAGSIVPGGPAMRLPYGDAMRCLGVLAVLWVHTCDMLLFSGRVDTLTWWVANFADAAGRWAVPVFIMLSGALLLHPSRPQTAGEFYRRRLARLGVATAFWSIVFAYFAVYYTGWVSAEWSPEGWQPSIWKETLAGRPYMHLHFVFRLAGLYALTPLLRVFVRHASFRLRVGMTALIVALAMANSMAAAFIKSEPTAFSSMWAFLGLYMTGSVLREIKLGRRGVALCWMGAAVSIVAMAVGTAWLIGPPGDTPHAPAAYPSVDMMLYDFLSPPRVLLSVCVWFIIANLFGKPQQHSRTQRAFAWLAPLTLGIYLVHPLFREFLILNGDLGTHLGQWLAGHGWDFGVDVYGQQRYRCLTWYDGFDWPNVWLGIPLVTAAIAAASILLTYILSKIPIVRKVVG